MYNDLHLPSQDQTLFQVDCKLSTVDCQWFQMATPLASVCLAVGCAWTSAFKLNFFTYLFLIWPLVFKELHSSRITSSYGEKIYSAFPSEFRTVSIYTYRYLAMPTPKRQQGPDVSDGGGSWDRLQTVCLLLYGHWVGKKKQLSKSTSLVGCHEKISWMGFQKLAGFVPESNLTCWRERWWYELKLFNVDSHWIMLWAWLWQFQPIYILSIYTYSSHICLFTSAFTSTLDLEGASICFSTYDKSTWPMALILCCWVSSLFQP